MQCLRSTVVAMIVAAGPLAAQNGGTYRNVALSFRVSTLGVGLEFSRMLGDRAALRFGGHYSKFDLSETRSDVEFDATVKLKSFSLLIDFFLSAGRAFHLTAGGVTNPMKVTAVGVPNGGSYTFNGNTYPADQVGTLTGKSDYPAVAPYVGLGFGSPHGKSKVGFLIDIGAVIAKPDFSLSASGAGSDPQLASDIRAKQDEIKKDIRDTLIVFPVLSLGLSLRF